MTTCDALRDLVPFVQFKKCEKHPWRSVTFIWRSVRSPARSRIAEFEYTFKDTVNLLFSCKNCHNIFKIRRKTPVPEVFQ